MASPFCKDCQYYEYTPGSPTVHRCLHTNNQATDLVIGQMYLVLSPQVIRNDDTKCGTAGAWFVQKI